MIDELGRIIVFPPPGYKKSNYDRVTVLVQEDTNLNASFFIFVTHVLPQEEEVIHKFEQPEGYPWELLLSNEDHHYGLWIRAVPNQDEASNPASWFRIINFQITACNVEDSKQEDVVGKDSIYNAFNTERGMDSSRLTKFVKRQEFIVAQVALRGKTYVGIKQEPFSDNDDELKKKVSLKKICKKKEKKVIDFAGIRNEGATCYLNSLLQTYFMIGAFSRAVFEMDVSEGKNVMKSIPNALQRLLYTLQLRKQGTTRTLLKSFGWGVQEMHQQNDVQEFNTVLMDALEHKANKMKDKKINFRALFEGKSKAVIQCKKVDFRSENEVLFTDLQLNVRGFHSLEKSLIAQTEEEELVGDNQYDAGKHGKQDAVKYNLFDEFPPVLQLQLMRFEFDPETLGLKKVHDRFEFPERLDLNPIIEKHKKVKKSERKYNIYQLHSILMHRGGFGAGHYFAYLKPAPSSHKDGDRWLKFNDEEVTEVSKSLIFNQAYGGVKLIKKTLAGRVVEVQQNTNISAYMLVYLRETEEERLLDRPSEDEIPQHLKQQFSEEIRVQNLIDEGQQIEKDQTDICIMSRESLLGWNFGGVVPYRSNFGDHIQEANNPRRRLGYLISRKFTASQAAAKIMYLAGWKEKECRFWFVKKSSGQFLTATNNLKKLKVGTMAINYWLYFEHLHSHPLFEEPDQDTIEKIKVKNELIREHVKNFEYEADGVGEAPLDQIPQWQIKENIRKEHRELLMKESSDGQDNKENHDGGISPEMFNLLEPSIEDDIILTFIKVYDCSKEQRIQVIDIQSFHQDMALLDIQKQLIKEKKLPKLKPNFLLRQKLSSPSTIQIKNYERVSILKHTDVLSDAVASNDRPFAILIFLVKTETDLSGKKAEEEAKEEVNNYLRQILTTIEVSVHEYPSRKWKASIRFQKHDSYDYVLDQVAKVLQEKKEEQKADKQYLQFYISREKRSTRADGVEQLVLFDKKANSTIEQMLTDSNCLYYKVAALSAEEQEGKYRIEFCRFNKFYQRCNKPEVLDVLKGGTIEELEVVISSQKDDSPRCTLLLQNDNLHRIERILLGHEKVDDIYPLLECSESSKAERGLILRIQEVTEDAYDVYKDANFKPLGVVWYMRGVGCFGEPAFIFYQGSDKFGEVVEKVNEQCRKVRQVWPQNTERGGKKISPKELGVHLIHKLEFTIGSKYRSGKISQISEDEMKFSADRVFSRRPDKLPCLGYVFENQTVYKAAKPLSIVKDSLEMG